MLHEEALLLVVAALASRGVPEKEIVGACPAATCGDSRAGRTAKPSAVLFSTLVLETTCADPRPTER